VSDSPREWLLAQLVPLVPSDWKVLPNQVDPSTIDRVTVIFKFTELTRLPEAPAGSLSNKVIITIIDPHKEHVKAENSLDDSVLELVTALDSLPHIVWSKAEKLLAFDQYLCWDITAQIITQKAA
jgi:hypothetical protein